MSTEERTDESTDEVEDYAGEREEVEQPEQLDQTEQPELAVKPEEPAEPPEPELAEPDELDDRDEPEDLPADPPLAPAHFQDRWSDVQNTFVEDPHRSVAEADALLTEVLTAYQQAVEQRRERITAIWSDATADTEKMRLALLDYRSLITTMLPAQADGETFDQQSTGTGAV